MKIEEFVSEYGKAVDKNGFIEKHIIVDYVPYIEKLEACDRIIEATCYKTDEISGKRVFRKSANIGYILFTMTLIQYYTDVELTNNVLDDFKLMDRRGLFTDIVTCLPAGEYDDFLYVYNSALEDACANNTNIIKWAEEKLATFNEAAAALLDVFAEEMSGDGYADGTGTGDYEGSGESDNPDSQTTDD